jgi:hypothetical protein
LGSFPIKEKQVKKEGLINRRFKVNIDVQVVEDKTGGMEELDCYLSKYDIDAPEKRFYKNENKIESYAQYRDYLELQFRRSSSKLMKQRDIEHYRVVADAIKNSTFWNLKKSKDWKMVCLGARNYWEGMCFKKLLKIETKTLDICEGPHPQTLDFLMDFNNLPREWDEKWDIVFSNSIDHANVATLAFFEWLRVLKTDGLMVLGVVEDETDEENKTNSIDCSFLTEETVERFIENTAKVDLLAKVSTTEECSYTYYLLQKM